jgi:hypothetical protein
VRRITNINTQINKKLSQNQKIIVIASPDDLYRDEAILKNSSNEISPANPESG